MPLPVFNHNHNNHNITLANSQIAQQFIANYEFTNRQLLQLHKQLHNQPLLLLGKYKMSCANSQIAPNNAFFFRRLYFYMTTDATIRLWEIVKTAALGVTPLYIATE